MQNTNYLLMIRPAAFGFNPETAVNNAFQLLGFAGNAQAKAALEFDNFARKLLLHGIDVTIIQDTPQPHTPDSIFPNNWISFHTGNKICLYPMFAPNRRQERKPAVIQRLTELFVINYTIDLTEHEAAGQYLEGTGSMVLDRLNKIAYACVSPRTSVAVLELFCQRLGYRPFCFVATDALGGAIYHTNVMLCVADKYAVVCLSAIADSTVRLQLAELLQQTGKSIIEITQEQMGQFAGNMLQVVNHSGEQFLVMSSTAFRSLTEEQVGRIRRYNNIIDSELDTIEKNGGGSARCMLAEVFLEKK